MTLRKIKVAAIVCGMIFSTGCVYQAELTEFLDDPTGMKVEKEMCTEYEPSDATEQTEYTAETEYNTEAVTELPQETEPVFTAATTTVTTTAQTTTTTITTISAEEEIIFTSADTMEQIEPQKETTTSITTAEESIEEVTKPTEASQNSHLDDYQKALEVYEYMTANGSGSCVQYAYQTYQMCAEYGLECYFVWTEALLLCDLETVQTYKLIRGFSENMCERLLLLTLYK